MRANKFVEFAFVALGVFLSACEVKNSSGTPGGPTTGNSTLTVALQGNLLGQINPLNSGTVAVSGPVSGQQNVDATGKTVFTGLPDGTYTVQPGFPFPFGYGKVQDTVSVAGPTSHNLVLPAAYDARLQKLVINGAEVHSGDTVNYPTADVEIAMEIMNPATQLIIAWPVFRRPNDDAGRGIPSVDGGLAVRPDPIQPGLQTSTVRYQGIQPCYQNIDGSYRNDCVNQTTKIGFTLLEYRTTSGSLKNYYDGSVDFVVNWVAR